MERVIIIGAGGHAQVVADILQCSRASGTSSVPIGYLDDDVRLLDKKFLGIPVLGRIDDIGMIDHDGVVVAIGDNAIRACTYTTLYQRGEKFIIARHPSAIIAPDIVIGQGTVICAGVIVNTGSVVGQNVILNTGCSVDHHNEIGDHVHIAPGAHLGGTVKIGNGTLVGIGATVMPGCSVGEYAIIGAGACVIESVTAGRTVVGVPARPLPKH